MYFKFLLLATSKRRRPSTVLWGTCLSFVVVDGPPVGVGGGGWPWWMDWPVMSSRIARSACVRGDVFYVTALVCFSARFPATFDDGGPCPMPGWWWCLYEPPASLALFAFSTVYYLFGWRRAAELGCRSWAAVCAEQWVGGCTSWSSPTRLAVLLSGWGSRIRFPRRVLGGICIII